VLPQKLLVEQQSPNVDPKHVALVLERLPQSPSVDTCCATVDIAIVSKTAVTKSRLIVGLILPGRMSYKFLFECGLQEFEVETCEGVGLRWAVGRE